MRDRLGEIRVAASPSVNRLRMGESETFGDLRCADEILDVHTVWHGQVLS